jgi:microsomal dipeptidase-like Zn-dependent dipeptidase
MRFPIIDLHCDLLSYLQEAPNANPEKNEGVGSNIPTLKEGNVTLQVMAALNLHLNKAAYILIYSPNMNHKFNNLVSRYPAYHLLLQLK